MKKRVIGFLGTIGSGKGAAGEYLQIEFAYQPLTFAGPLKDAVSCIFNWPRNMLEGDSSESREWREKIDPFWTETLSREVTPRKMLQLMGTEAGRHVFGEKLWIASVLNRIDQTQYDKFVITDVRFQNEVQSLIDIGAELYIIERTIPEWFECARYTPAKMAELYPDVHVSEWDWFGEYYDKIPIIKNTSTIAQLYRNIRESVKP